MKYNPTYELYPFQTGDVEFLVEHPKCINGNAMGLGKTIEALRLAYETQPRHVLIVATKTMVPEWWFYVNDILDEDCLTPHPDGDRLIGLDLGGPRFVCVNYDLLSTPRYLYQLMEVKWDLIIFDEVHKMKNPATKRTRAAFLLVPYVPRVVMMSGTPQQNGPQDLFTPFHIINPKLYRSHRQWIGLFCITTLMRVGNKYFKQIVGAKNQDELRQLLSLHMVRHEKEDVLTDLPPKQFRTVPVVLGASEFKAYKQMEDDLFALLDTGELITAPAVIAQLTRLRQICLDPHLLSRETMKISSNSAKTQALLDIIDGCDGKVVVFSHFEQYIRLIAQELEKRSSEGMPAGAPRSTKYVVLTGQENIRERGMAKYTFQNDPDIKVFLGTIGAGGEGIDLFAANTCVFTDLHWNSKQNEQAEDRLHRIGQHDSVLIVDLWCQHTVEDHVHKVVRRKEKMFNEIVTRRSVVDEMRRDRQGG